MSIAAITPAIKYAKHLYIQANNGVFSAKTP